MPQPTIRQLRTFLAVAEAGSISTAARSLNLTQPAASQQLRELERTLRIRLLERAAGKVQPTAAGAALLEPARRVQTAIDDAVVAAAAHRSGEIGRVRLGTGATACIYLLPPVLAAVKQRMPALDVVIATGNSAEMTHRVEIGELDMALITLPAPSSRALAVTRLFTDPLVALLPAQMMPGATALSAAQVATLPLILYEPGGTTRGVIDAWFRRAGVRPSPIMQLDSIETIKVLVSGGLGASIMPALAVAAPPPATIVRPLRPAVMRQLAIVLRREKVLDRGLRLTLEVLRDRGLGAAPHIAI
jgi:DNA-binding transcriptional LysR family regulator